MGEYMIRSGYESRPEPLYFVDLDPNTDIVYQPDVYTHASELASALGAWRLIDVGCGKAGKLVALEEHFETFGIDHGENIAWCREHHSTGVWIEHDLEQPDPIPVDARDSIVVCADVIEHLRQPQHLAAGLLRLLEDGALAVLISTPEREGTYGPWHQGPPPNVAHAREWTIRELTTFLRRIGFRHGTAGLTRNNTAENQSSTILCVYTNNEDMLPLIEDTLIESVAR